MPRKWFYTYEELMDDQRNDSPEFSCHELGDGMLFLAHRKKTVGFAFLVNKETEKCFELMDRQGNLTSFSKEDIDFNSISDLEYTSPIYNLKVGYGIAVNDFLNGTALFQWTYHVDDSQYGYTYDEANFKRVYGFIDKHCQIVVPFQRMTEKRLARLLRQQANNELPIKSNRANL